MGEHTPTPWKLRYSEAREWSPEPRPERILSPSGDPVWVACIGMSSDPESIANAAFIVKAVNSHDALVTALEGTIAWFESENFVPKVEGARIGSVHIGPVTKGVFDLAREALAKAATS